MFTRRTLIKTGAVSGMAALVLPGIESAASSGAAGPVSAQHVDDVISIVTPNDPTFSSKLDALFPGLSHDPVFQKIAAHAALVTNTGGRNINAYSTHWEITTPTGGYQVTRMHYFHPSSDRPRTVHFGLKGNKTRFTGRIPVLKAGATKLLTPFFHWSPRYYRTHPAPNWKKILSATASRQFFLQEISNATGSRFVVDAVVVDHNTLIGPDSSNLAREYRVTRNAEHDLAYEILKVVKSGGSRDQVVSALQEQAFKALPERSDPHHIYLAVKRRQAKVLYRRLEKAKPEQFLRTLHYLKNQPKTTTGLHRSA